jgi:TRAP transporter TAXI family solute receptor
MPSTLRVPKTRRRQAAVAGAAACTLLLAGCGGGGSEEVPGADGSLSMATGGTGGVYYPYGGGIANVITQNVPGQTATVQETNASVDNMLLIQAGAADLALGLGDVVSDAVAGVNSFDGNPVDICTLGKLYNNYTQPITTAITGIRTVEDMRGKRVSLGSPGSASEVLAIRILEAAGLNADTDIQRAQLGVGETVQALRDGTIDAGFWSGGLPTGALVDLASTGQMVLIPTAQYTDAMAQKYGDYYFADEIPAGVYQGQTEPSPQVVAPNVLVVRKDMPEQLQQDITRAIFENKEALIQVHPAAEELDPATADDVGFIEVCPGARAYFDQAAG